MRVVTLEEHIRFSSFTRRFDQSAVAKRGFSSQARQPGMENWARQLEDLGEDRLKSMDESGITVQVVSVLGPGADLIEGDEGAALAREYNNAVSDKIKLHPNRFAAFAHLPMANAATAADELARTVNELGFCGAPINGLTQDVFLDDKSFAPLLARAESLKVPLYLHPGIPPKSVRDAYYAGISPDVRLTIHLAVTKSAASFSIAFRSRWQISRRSPAVTPIVYCGCPRDDLAG